MTDKGTKPTVTLPEWTPTVPFSVLPPGFTAYHQSPDFHCLWRPWIVTHFGPLAPQKAHPFFILSDPQPLAQHSPKQASIPPGWTAKGPTQTRVKVGCLAPAMWLR